MGRRSEIEAMTARIEALEREVQRLSARTAAAGPLLDDSRRLEELAERAERLSRDTTVAIDELTGLATRAAVGGAPRFRAEINKVYRATSLGFVSLYFVGGRTGCIQIVAGTTDPPDEVVGEVNTMSDISSSAGAVVRAGEFWGARFRGGWNARGNGSGFVCVFTPLF
ncbi:ABC transporter C-terminal domain-containing protein [Rugosimonospora africana]|uniref:Uncharacterized protein n=1 Tax=Rugosimonospora africana TaxID=556532 RepID=A0A8J3VT56_9ACTN|nr:ABC transporter C-terminal domain-containing protein [Rugosimonospora africana]GIH17739.1 hypothetical protein Raf01_59110 [Rugosimonospora africana]